jgi:hypothetical protein
VASRSSVAKSSKLRWRSIFSFVHADQDRQGDPESDPNRHANSKGDDEIHGEILKGCE